MKSSNTVVNIAAALLKAQKLMGGAKKGSSNPYFKSKYADLGAVLEACKDLLNENGVVILQPHTTTDKGKFVETTLLHETGEWVSSETEIVCSKESDPQAQGSAISYARRYGLQSLLSMPAEDDDGEGAMKRTRATTPAAVAVTTPNTVVAVTGTTQNPEEVKAKIPSWRKPKAAPAPEAGGMEF